MKRGLALGVLALLLGLGFWMSRGHEPSALQREAHALRPGSGFLLPTPAPRPKGDLRIRGVVLGERGPLSGVRVSATRAEAGHTLSTLSCAELLQQSSWGRAKLAACMDEAASTVLELVLSRQGEAPLYAETSTANDGSFSLDGLPAGDFVLWAVDARGTGMWPDIAAGAEGLSLRLEAVRWLEGTVLGEDGGPLAGVRVTALHTEHTRFFDTESGPDGRYRLGPLPLADYRIALSKEGWLPELVTGTPNQQTTLRRPRRLVGRVLHQGAPAPGAEVRLRRLEGDRGPLWIDVAELAVTSDAEGRFTFEPLWPFAHRLTASLGASHAIARVRPDAPETQVVLELGNALRLEGTVRDSAGSPIAGARVRAHPDGKLSEAYAASTDAAGRYRLGPLARGTHRLVALAPRYLDAVQELKLGAETGPVDFTLTSSAPIEGHLVDDEGHPLADFIIELQLPDGAPRLPNGTPSTVSDEAGRFQLNAPAPGRYTLHIEDLEGSFRERHQVDAPDTKARLVLDRKARVSGTLTDEHGAPVPGARMRLWRMEEPVSAQARGMTDARGHFSLWGLSPGRYLLEAAEGSGGVERLAFHPVELREREAVEVPLRLEAGRTLSGLVVDEAGHPVSEVSVFTFSFAEHVPEWRREFNPQGTDGPTPSVRTGADGRFTLRNLQARELELRTHRTGYDEPPPEERRVRAGDTDVRIVLRRMARIHGRLTGPDGAPLRHFRVNGEQTMAPEGAFSLPIDPAGHYSLELSAQGMATRVLRGKAREGTDVDLGEVRMSPARRVSGRVLDAETSKPVERAWVLTSTFREPSFPVRTHDKVVRTDGDGAFTLPAEEPGPLQLFVEAEGYRARGLELGSGDVEGLTVLLERGARLTLSARDEQGRPATVSVYLDREGADRSTRGTYVSVEHGRSVMSGLEPGRYQVHVSSFARQGPTPVFPIPSVDIPATGNVSVDLRARTSGATLEVHARGDATSAFLYPGIAPPIRLHGDCDELQSRSVRPTGELPGVVTFRNLPPGRVTLIVLKYQAFIHREEIDLPATGTVVREVTPD
ncbi:carboxypeptidase regulatory-like domain-containing protein, partial [Pyxidicoccus fallax]